MQRDTDLTFKDICGTLNAILKNIEDIYKHAVDPVATNNALDLRFLTYNNSSDSDPVLHLTEKGANIGETNYVAVSYTWQKFDPVDDTVAVPRYRISATAALRNPRSQNAVLHRAVQFARAYDVPFIWIDQDCIDQQDRIDVQRHLHIVHEIFYQSRYAIGLLSFHIHNESHVKSLQYIHEGVCLDELNGLSESRRFEESEIAQRMMRALRLLTTISVDQWFSRTWTFMERHSAPHMHLLLPCDASLAMDNKTKRLPAELELSLLRLQQVRKKLEETRYYSPIREEMFSGRQNHPQDRQLIFEAISRLSHLISRKFMVEFKTPPWRQALNLRQVTAIFSHIEQCENTVLSDRLLILGYLCGFSRRLKMDELNHYKYSYSTCAFVLLLMNGWFLRVWDDDDATFCWNHTFKDVLTQGSWQEQHGGGELLTPFQESMEVLLGQERVSGDFIEKLRAIFGVC
jgi:hypothetical protein